MPAGASRLKLRAAGGQWRAAAGDTGPVCCQGPAWGDPHRSGLWKPAATATTPQLQLQSCSFAKEGADTAIRKGPQAACLHASGTAASARDLPLPLHCAPYQAGISARVRCAGECSAPAYLANVCVAKAAHRQGIGRQLIDNAQRLAEEWGDVLLSPLTASPLHPAPFHAQKVHIQAYAPA